jgi:tRNA (cmo5U34)-methyltransferase
VRPCATRSSSGRQSGELAARTPLCEDSTWDPASYLDVIAAEIPGYDEFQDRLIAVDSSVEMLDAARAALPGAELRLSRLQDALPEGLFDLVYSALAVHHLDAGSKRDLFRRAAEVLRPGGVFVLADLVVAADPADRRISIDWELDVPDRLDDQLRWLGEAGFDAVVFWEDRDLAIVRARRARDGST